MDNKTQVKKNINPKIVFLVLAILLIILAVVTIAINGSEKKVDPYSPYAPINRYEEQETFTFYSDEYSVDSIEITRAGKKIKITGDEDVYCDVAPCPEMTYEHIINFDSNNMSEINQMLDVLNRSNESYISVDYDALSFEYKQIISAMEQNDQSEMHAYSLQFWSDDTRYDIKTNDESIMVSSYDISTDIHAYYELEFEEENLDQVRLWVNQMCSRQNNPNATYRYDEDIFLTPNQKKTMDAVINNDESYFDDDGTTTPTT